jgi:hypothetical protein
VRWASLGAGAALVALAFAAATRVSDTREGLIAEVITLLGGLVGVSLLIYGLTVGRAFHAPTRTASRSDLPGERGGEAGPPSPPSGQGKRGGEPSRARSTGDILLGAGGIGLALILLGGLALSGGGLWLGLGFALLLPMIAGSVYLCVRFLRASP